MLNIIGLRIKRNIHNHDRFWGNIVPQFGKKNKIIYSTPCINDTLIKILFFFRIKQTNTVVWTSLIINSVNANTKACQGEKKDNRHTSLLGL